MARSSRIFATVLYRLQLGDVEVELCLQLRIEYSGAPDIDFLPGLAWHSFRRTICIKCKSSVTRAMVLSPSVPAAMEGVVMSGSRIEELHAGFWGTRVPISKQGVRTARLNTFSALPCTNLSGSSRRYEHVPNF